MLPHEDEEVTYPFKVERQLYYLFPDEDPVALFRELYQCHTHHELAALLQMSANTIYLYAERRGMCRRRGPPERYMELEKRLGSDPVSTLNKLKERMTTWRRVGMFLGIEGRMLRTYREWKGIGGKAKTDVRRGDWIFKWEWAKKNPIDW